MRKNFSTTLLAVTLLSIGFQTVFAKSVGDWKGLATHTSSEIALKTIKGERVFGKLNSVTDTELILQVATKKELTADMRKFQKSEIKSIWTASLRFKKNPGVHTAIGAGIGAGAAGGIASGTVVSSDKGTQYFWIAVAIGAGIGGTLGYFFGNRGHQIKDLVYEP